MSESNPRSWAAAGTVMNETRPSIAARQDRGIENITPNSHSWAVARPPRRRRARRPLCRTTTSTRDHRPALSVDALRVLGRHVDERRREDRVVPQIVEDELVVGVPVRVPRVRAIVPRQGSQVERRRAVAHDPLKWEPS